MAGGDFTELELEDGSVKVAQRHRYMMSPLRSIQKKLQREPVGAFGVSLRLIAHKRL